MDVFPGKPRIRLGVWGLGRGLHIASVAESLHLDVVAGCDFNPRFIEQFRSRIPGGRVTADPAEFLDWDLDAVLVATFCPDHAEHAIRCLEAGRHVLSEVTAFHTPGQGVRLVEAVRRSGRVYQLAAANPGSDGARILGETLARFAGTDPLDPRRILFIRGPDGAPVATASAYGDDVEGYVHFVALDPAHAGRGLGLQASLAVLHAFRERGCTRAVLDTDDFRTAALKVYLRLGFRPLITDDGHPARWRRVALRLGQPAILDSVAFRPLS